jgi:mRNA interferase RelE/StbE
LNYQLFIERSAQKNLAKIQPNDRERIIVAIRNLADNPRPAGSKKLTGRNAWRIRIGDYRVIYEIEDNKLIILVVDVGHRKEIYRS